MFSKHIALIALVAAVALAACRPPATPPPPTEAPPAAGIRNELALAADAVLADSGLLAAILPDFTSKTGVRVRVLPAAPDQASEMGARRAVDMVLTQDAAASTKLVEAGAASRPLEVFEDAQGVRFILLPIMPTPDQKTNLAGAIAFANWLGSPEVQVTIERFGSGTGGAAPFRAVGAN